jgi:hypothetical protein
MSPYPPPAERPKPKSLLENAVNANFTECDRIVADSPSQLNRQYEVELQGSPCESRLDWDPYYHDGSGVLFQCDSLDGNGDTLLHYAIRMNRCGPYCRFWLFVLALLYALWSMVIP